GVRRPAGVSTPGRASPSTARSTAAEGAPTRSAAPAGVSTGRAQSGARPAPPQEAPVTQPRLLTGDRPTGKLHLGHYVGSLENRLRLQEEYECFFLIADYHVLTTGADRTREIKEHIYDLVLDYLSVGIDPARSTIYLQSLVPE